VGLLLRDSSSVPVCSVDVTTVRTVGALVDCLHDGVNALVLDAQAGEHLLRAALQNARGTAVIQDDPPPPMVVAGPLPTALARLALEARCLASPALLTHAELEFVLSESSKLARTHAERSAAWARRWAQGSLGDWVGESLSVATTPRQRVIVALSLLGLDRARISVALGIEVRTVDFHIGGVLAESGRATLEDLARPLKERLAKEETRGPELLDSRTPRMGNPTATWGATSPMAPARPASTSPVTAGTASARLTSPPPRRESSDVDDGPRRARQAAELAPPRQRRSEV
jgi:DNA-binding NarL/FixJ family response regulator